MEKFENNFIIKPAAFIVGVYFCASLMACARYAPDGFSGLEIAVAADVIFLAFDQTCKGKLDKPPVLIGKFIGYGLLLGVASLFMEGHFIDVGRYF